MSQTRARLSFNKSLILAHRLFSAAMAKIVASTSPMFDVSLWRGEAVSREDLVSHQLWYTRTHRSRVPDLPGFIFHPALQVCFGQAKLDTS